ncbi:MAG: hypothetical protein NUV49_01870, partial [Patescibacteria group bacterium]|nr:hypothetical protein [Patescibacteria group bacterium]
IAKVTGGEIIEFTHPRLAGTYKGLQGGSDYIEIHTYRGIEGCRGGLIIEGEAGLFITTADKGWVPAGAKPPKAAKARPDAARVDASSAPAPTTAEEADAMASLADIAAAVAADGAATSHEVADEGEFAAILDAPFET